MLYLLFIFYSVLFCWLISRVGFFKKSGLSNQLLITLFIIRIVALLVSCYANENLIKYADSLVFQKSGIEEFNLLFADPHQYFLNFFHNPYPHGYSRIFEDYHSFWNNIRNILMAKMLSVFNFFSFKSFYVNTLFFNFIVFFGCVALYRVFINLFPRAVYQVIFCIFILPSALFYSSMIHRDGLIFLSVSIVIYHLFFLIRLHQPTIKRILIIAAFLFLIFLLRNFVLVALLPALISWIIASKYPKRALPIFILVYFFGAILFFSSGLISPKTNLPYYVSSRQQSFMEIGKLANSTVAVVPLKPTFASFVANAPIAFNMVFMRPYISSITSLPYAAFAIEIMLIEFLILIFFLFHKKKVEVDPVNYFCIFFSFSMLMVIGYTVPIIGALVRYRSIYFIFLLIPVVLFIDWKKLYSFIQKRNIQKAS